MSTPQASVNIEKPDSTESEVESGRIEIYGAAEHNLKHIDLSIPRNALVVFTGLSGSGKSSLAFETIYAEGQRRYMESFSAYARQFMGNLKRPDVEKIDGLSPVIAIEQKTISKIPRSTVGTVTEVYDFLRLLYARASDAYSSVTGKKMVQFSDEEILNTILSKLNGRSICVLAPLIRGRKGHYRELFAQLIKAGFTKARIDNKITELEPEMKLSRYKTHDIELVIDRLTIKEETKSRLRQSVNLALKKSKGTVMILDMDEDRVFPYSRNLMCLESGISYDEPQPNSFSFNTPYGYCPDCRGTGTTYEFDKDEIMPDMSKSINAGGLKIIEQIGDTDWMKSLLKTIAEKHQFKLSDPLHDIPEEGLHEILYGSPSKLKVKTHFGSVNVNYEGLLDEFTKAKNNSDKKKLRENFYVKSITCKSCNGYRLKDESLWFKVDEKHIGEVADLQLNHLYEWVSTLEGKMSGRQLEIARPVIKEICSRTSFLLDVGLDYLSLNRPALSLSGGEAQRIRLATQIGSELINVTYILDEPSIGLHQRDNQRLIDALKKLRDNGNTVIVVEHDKDMIQASDYVVDIGPFAGVHGGKIIANCKPSELNDKEGLTADYMAGRKNIECPAKRRKGNGKAIVLKGASGHNLKNVNVSFPLGKMIGLTGVSGSGKSTLTVETLLPIMKNNIYRSVLPVQPYKSVSGLHHINKVIEINQSPIGRTPRSNPATYTGVFTDIRQLFTVLPEAKIRGYKPGRFSFNIKGGRCEECRGAGVKLIEMNFLPDVHVSCPVCLEKRYNRQTLEVRYKDKSIGDVLNLTIEDAYAFFDKIPKIRHKLETLKRVGLGYVTLGQASTTLSGGEAQRVKLASELSKKDTGDTFYILDEPTTGLHFEDINVLMKVLNELVDRGNTVLIIEHNLDVIKLMDYIIDLGPEGGDKGGEIIAEGTPEELVKSKISQTARFLKAEL